LFVLETGADKTDEQTMPPILTAPEH